MNIQDSAASFIVSVFCLIALPLCTSGWAKSLEERDMHVEIFRQSSEMVRIEHHQCHAHGEPRLLPRSNHLLEFVRWNSCSTLR